jgi:hypothetical protein
VWWPPLRGVDKLQCLADTHTGPSHPPSPVAHLRLHVLLSRTPAKLEQRDRPMAVSNKNPSFPVFATPTSILPTLTYSRPLAFGLAVPATP